MDGLDFAEKAHEIYPNAVIVILTGYDSLPALRSNQHWCGRISSQTCGLLDELKAAMAAQIAEIHAGRKNSRGNPGSEEIFQQVSSRSTRSDLQKSTV